MTQIESLFAKDIFRQINGVIKAEQLDNDSLRQELEEYVITDELDKHFRSFYHDFNTSLNQPVNKHGVWISGFFGSGKSHFLKMLGYLLSNQPVVDGRKPLDFFDSTKVTDGMFRLEMARPAQLPMDVILFNIDSKASSSAGQKDTIVNVFWRVFDDMQGYFGEVPHIAEMESQLDRDGLYESFKQSFTRIHGDSWENARRAHAFHKKKIEQALQEVTGLDAVSASGVMYDLKASLKRSPEGFAKRVREYLDRKGKQHRVLFLVDEVGQYIGDSSDLMLNLQTVVEDFAIYCDGRAWVLVTSQQDIDSIIKNLNQLKKNDFSKIQGRFYTPLSLSSANTDKVIKKRLLQKTPEASDSLEAFYAGQKVNLGNLVTFSQDAAYFPKIKDSQEFVDCYPFLPYQFPLLQLVFRSVREAGGSGKHMAEGERSMLESFKLTLEKRAKEKIGSLAPFYSFYQAIEGFLEHTIRWVFSQAEQNPELDAFDVNLLKILFMIRWVKELKPNQDNLLALMIDDVDNDKAAMRQRVQEALGKLERQTLVQRTGDEYYFLTNEEQDIMRKIKAISIDPGEVNHKLQLMIFGQIFTLPKLRYDASHSYPFNKKLDGIDAGQPKAALTLHVITHCGDLESGDMECSAQTLSGNMAVVRLPQDNHLYAEIQQLLQTERYFQLHGGGGGSTITQRINDQFLNEKTSREKEIQHKLERLITQSDVFTGGEKAPKIERGSAGNLFTDALRRLVLNVYPKLEQIQAHYEKEADVDAALTEPVNQQSDLKGETLNHQARQTMINWFSDQQLRQAVVTVSRLTEHFEQKPFGWAELDALGVMAELIYAGKLELRLNQQRQSLEPGLTKRLRSKQGGAEHILQLQREISLEDIRQTQLLLKEEFDQVSPPQDAEELFKVFRGVLQQQSAKLQAYSQKSRDIYPCHELLLETNKVQLALLGPAHYQEFFDVLSQYRARLQGHHDHYQDLESFYEGQKAVFDKGLAQLEALETDIDHVQDDTLRKNYDDARAILYAKNDTVYRLLPKVSLLLAPVIQGVEKLLNQAREQALSQLATAGDNLRQAYASLTDNPAFTALLAPLERLEREVEQAKSIDTVLARGSQLQSLEARIHDQAKDLIKPIPVDPIDDPINPISPSRPEPPPKPIQVVHPVKLAVRPLLETESEVEAYIDRFSAELRRLIRENKRIQLQ